MDNFPKVLIVLTTKIKEYDPVNLLLRMQFAAWPKERIAQIYSGEREGFGVFCGDYYQIAARDRACGATFERLKARFASATGGIGQHKPGTGRSDLSSRLVVWRGKLRDAVLESGAWELFFPIRPSKELCEFVRAFEPDLIYCQGYSIAFASLPMWLKRRYGTPLCFQTTDDWPARTYRYSPVGWLLRLRAAQLVKAADIRIAFGRKMAEVFRGRYGREFNVSYHLDDPNRFRVAAGGKEGHIRIAYVGNLGHRRFEAIADLVTAVRLIDEHVTKIEVCVYTGDVPSEMPSELLSDPHLTLRPLPKHNELPSLLKGADVLFLPESFRERRAAIELSISTKAHLYMMSGRPILAYGPSYSGTISYAKTDGWGLVVTERSVEKLRVALLEAILKTDVVRVAQRKAEECIHRNHDLASGQQRFLAMLLHTKDETGEPTLLKQQGGATKSRRR